MRQCSTITVQIYGPHPVDPSPEKQKSPSKRNPRRRSSRHSGALPKRFLIGGAGGVRRTFPRPQDLDAGRGDDHRGHQKSPRHAFHREGVGAGKKLHRAGDLTRGHSSKDSFVFGWKGFNEARVFSRIDTRQGGAGLCGDNWGAGNFRNIGIIYAMVAGGTAP